MYGHVWHLQTSPTCMSYSIIPQLQILYPINVYVYIRSLQTRVCTQDENILPSFLLGCVCSHSVPDSPARMIAAVGSTPAPAAAAATAARCRRCRCCVRGRRQGLAATTTAVPAAAAASSPARCRCSRRGAMAYDGPRRRRRRAPSVLRS